jgi:hypothetical protein
MVIKQVAPYGDWKSELTSEAVTAGARSLSSPRVDVSQPAKTKQHDIPLTPRTVHFREMLLPRITQQWHQRNHRDTVGRQH